MGIPDWGVQSCELTVFVDQVRRFVDDLRQAIDRATPGLAQTWMEKKFITPV